MSTQTTVQQAALIASAVANSLAATPGAPLTAGSAAALLGAVLQAAGPLVNPNIGLTIALANIALSAIHVATTTGAGLTPEQHAQMLAADDAAISADKAAMAAANPVA